MNLMKGMEGMYSDSPNLNSYSKSTVSYWLASLEGTEPSNRSETYVEVC